VSVKTILGSWRRRVSGENWAYRGSNQTRSATQAVDRTRAGEEASPSVRQNGLPTLRQVRPSLAMNAGGKISEPWAVDASRIGGHNASRLVAARSGLRDG